MVITGESFPKVCDPVYQWFLTIWGCLFMGDPPLIWLVYKGRSHLEMDDFKWLVHVSSI